MKYSLLLVSLYNVIQYLSQIRIRKRSQQLFSELRSTVGSLLYVLKLVCYYCVIQVEKARQRIAQGKRTSMYTSQASIKAKVGDVLGWQELLSIVGFRFEPANGELPESVFFPSTDHVGILNRCSNTLYAFLGMCC